MEARERSLRLSVGKWFEGTAQTPVRVLAFGRIVPGGPRYVRVGIRRDGKSPNIVFFQHNDGSWNVFPPIARTLSMSPCAVAA